MLLCLPLQATCLKILFLCYFVFNLPCLPAILFTRLLVNHVTLSPFASNLFTRLLVNHITLSLFVSNLFTRLTRQLS